MQWFLESSVFAIGCSGDRIWIWIGGGNAESSWVGFLLIVFFLVFFISGSYLAYSGLPLV